MRPFPNRYCPACLKSQPHMNLGRYILCESCCYRREYVPLQRPVVSHYARKESGARVTSFQNLCNTCADSARSAGQALRVVFGMTPNTCVQCFARA